MFKLDQDRLFMRHGLHTLTAAQFLAAYAKMLGRRWLRIVPLYAIVLVSAHPLLARLGGGPFWQTFVMDKATGDNCTERWFLNFLFVNNIVPRDPALRCFPWSFYFALDFQYHAITPWLMLLYRRVSYYAFAAVVFVLLVGSVLANAVPASTAWESTEPLVMLAPFLFGVVLFLLYGEVNDRADEGAFFTDPAIATAATSRDAPLSAMVQAVLTRKRNRVLCIWSGLALAVAVALVEWAAHQPGSSGAFRRAMRVLLLPLWSTALCLAVLPMLLGYGGWVRRALSHRLWCAASRLVFAAYLVGPLVVKFSNATATSPWQPVTNQMAFLVWGNVWLSLLLALVLSLTIEQPMAQLTGHSASNPSTRW
jgi:hypothetical protein